MQCCRYYATAVKSWPYGLNVMDGKNRGGGKNFISTIIISAVIEHQGEKTFELSSKQRHEWIARRNRKDWVP